VINLSKHVERVRGQGPTMECGGNACCQIPLTTNGQGFTTNQSKWDMSADGEYDYMCVPDLHLLASATMLA